MNEGVCPLDMDDDDDGDGDGNDDEYEYDDDSGTAATVMVVVVGGWMLFSVIFFGDSPFISRRAVRVNLYNSRAAYED